MSFNNRKSIMPDVSPRPKSDFDVRNRTIAIMLAAAFVAVIALSIGAFSVHDTESVKKALAEIEVQKTEQLAAYAEKMSELDIYKQELDGREVKLTKREETVKKRETDLSEAETALEEERAAFADEKALFYASQTRVYELSKKLYLELAPNYESADPAVSE